MANALADDDLYNWLNQLELSKPKKHIARDFSDAVLIAELLKVHYPRLVELHNYPTANSVSNKLKNWTTLNDKVLSKIGLLQTVGTLKEASTANRTVIEKILMAVKNKIEEIEISKKSQETEHENTFHSDVPYEDYSIILEQLAVKEEELHSLQAKNAHLEAMLNLKTQRINDLTFQVKRCACHKTAEYQ